MLKSICVFCGSSSGANPSYLEAARNLGKVIAEKNIRLVYGGGNVGIMGEIANSVLKNGGKVSGVIPKSLFDKELAHKGLTELIVVDTMHERKAKMSELSDGFIALPGGIGTIEEFFEVMTWAQLGFQVKPCGLMNVTGYYDALVNFMDHMTYEKFLRPEHRKIMIVEQEPLKLIEGLNDYKPSYNEKWLDEINMLEK